MWCREEGAIKVLASCAFSPRYLLILGDIDWSVHTVHLFDEGEEGCRFNRDEDRAFLNLLTSIYVRWFNFTRINF